MKIRSISLKSMAALLALLLMTIVVMPAFAVDGEIPVVPVVTASVTVRGIDLKGLDATQTLAAIQAATADATFAPLPVRADGHKFSLDVGSVLRVDTASLVRQALAAETTLTLVPFTVSSPAVATFVGKVAAKVDHKAVSAKRYISHRRLKLKASRAGAKVYPNASRARLVAALRLVAAGSAPVTVTLPMKAYAPKVTGKNIGKTIIVSLREFKVILYKGSRIEKKYSCAIGMPAHPTPVGTFKVIAKSAHPSWRNPGSAWAVGMPAVIGPGYYNPLGLRALYINASGIRIHGTSKTYSMGHAASHGCIRLTNHNVVDIFPRVKVGTPVYILR